MISKEKIIAAISAAVPSGLLFAKRSNYEYGYLVEEGRLVNKYLTKPSTILVIAAGNGREARPIANQGHDIVCTDIAPFYLEVAQKLFKEEGINNIRFKKMDVFKEFPFEAGTFDFVFFSIYSLCGEKRFEVMQRIHTVMRSGGLLLLSCCTPKYPLSRPKKDLEDWIWIKSEKQLEQETSIVGFGLIESALDPLRNEEYRISILRRK